MLAVKVFSLVSRSADHIVMIPAYHSTHLFSIHKRLTYQAGQYQEITPIFWPMTDEYNFTPTTNSYDPARSDISIYFPATNQLAAATSPFMSMQLIIARQRHLHLRPCNRSPRGSFANEAKLSPWSGARIVELTNIYCSPDVGPILASGAKATNLNNMILF